MYGSKGVKIEETNKKGEETNKKGGWEVKNALNGQAMGSS